MHMCVCGLPFRHFIKELPPATLVRMIFWFCVLDTVYMSRKRNRAEALRQRFDTLTIWIISPTQEQSMEALAHLFRPDSNDSGQNAPIFKWSHSERYFARKTSNNGGLLRLVGLSKPIPMIRRNSEANRQQCYSLHIFVECQWEVNYFTQAKSVSQ